MSTQADREPVTDDQTICGKFHYERKSSRQPFNVKACGVITGEVRVRGDSVYIYERGSEALDTRKSFVLGFKAAKSLFTDHDYDMSMQGGRTLVVGGTGYDKLVVTFHRIDGERDR